MHPIQKTGAKRPCSQIMSFLTSTTHWTSSSDLKSLHKYCMMMMIFYY